MVLDGRDITTLPPQKRGFGMVFQHYALFPHAHEDNVAFGLEARGMPGRSASSAHGARWSRLGSGMPVVVESSRYREVSSSEWRLPARW